jgi:carboxypeptidase family protein
MNASGRRVTAIVIAFAAVGCASQGSGAGASVSDLSGVHVSQVASSSASGLSVGPKVGTGTVTGVVRTYGGPMMPNGQMADDGNPTSGITVTATRNGTTVASMVTGSDGSYRFTLPPGSYAMKGCSDATVTIAAGQVVHQDLRCDVP